MEQGDELLKQRHAASSLQFRELTRIFEEILRSRSADDKNAALFNQKACKQHHISLMSSA